MDNTITIDEVLEILQCRLGDVNQRLDNPITGITDFNMGKFDALMELIKTFEQMKEF